MYLFFCAPHFSSPFLTFLTVLQPTFHVDQRTVYYRVDNQQNENKKDIPGIQIYWSDLGIEK